MSPYWPITTMASPAPINLRLNQGLRMNWRLVSHKPYIIHPFFSFFRDGKKKKPFDSPRQICTWPLLMHPVENTWSINAEWVEQRPYSSGRKTHGVSTTSYERNTGQMHVYMHAWYDQYGCFHSPIGRFVTYVWYLRLLWQFSHRNFIAGRITNHFWENHDESGHFSPLLDLYMPLVRP